MRLRFDTPPTSKEGPDRWPPWLRFLVRWASRFAYLGLLLLLLGLTAYVSFSLFVRSGVTPVPDLSGMTQDEAAGALQDKGLELSHDPRQDDFDAKVPAGEVLRQRPAARALVKRGSGIDVAFSLGPQVLEVPDLEGKTAQAAQVALAAGGLGTGRSFGVYSSDAEEGTVVAQQPPAGSNVAPGTTLDLLVSRGNRAAVYVMPDLVYRRYDDVQRFFTQRGFRLGSVKYEVYEGIPEGVILRQFPLAGHPLDRRDTVSLVVSRTAEARPLP
ncbi:MAG: PASTA domain-containing protein [Acidobacteria bacterium]|nr:PASTA domain-containing protein [Acidobacteriota bacterium]